MRPLCFVLAVMGLGGSAGGDPPGAPELGAPASAPIKHEKFFRGERELFGYNPRFEPNVVTFDPDNRPYIRSQGPMPGWTNTVGVVQTLDADGRWLRLDFTPPIKERYPEWDGCLFTGPFAEERIVFDSAGDAYMNVNCTRSNIKRNFLLYSKDRCRSWQLYELPGVRAQFEVPDGHNDCQSPPVILSSNTWTGGPLYLITPVKTPDGRLDVSNRVTVTTDPKAFPSPHHSGTGNSTVTKDGLTHIAYLSMEPAPDKDGTPQYAVTYDRSTGKCGAPVLLGFGGRGAPDNHNGPVMAADSKGYLHAVLGAHHDPFRYTRSLQPNSINGGWTEPVAFGKPQPRTPSGSYTYVSLICDKNDTLHVVARYAGWGYFFCLDYLRKKADQPWEDRGHLVIPFRRYYSCWYHKLNMDRKGRLFLNYIYYGDQYCEGGEAPHDQCGDEIAAYRQKWPDEKIELAPDSRKLHGHWLGVKPHDPAILMSDDGGDTWRLALTPDFVEKGM